MLRLILNNGTRARVAPTVRAMGSITRSSVNLPCTNLYRGCGVTWREFSITSTSLAPKKKGGKGKNNSSSSNEEEEVFVDIDPKKIIQEAEASFKEIVSLCDKEMKALKLGGANPDIFNKLSIPLGDNVVAKFTEVAQVVVKGGNLITITVFDPNNTKRVRSAILAAELNMNPESDPNNPQALKIMLSTASSERNATLQKNFKKCMDEYTKLGRTKSLTAVRTKVLKDLKDVKGSKDVVKKLTTDLDKLVKKYSDEISTIYKKANDGLRK